MCARPNTRCPAGESAVGVDAKVPRSQDTCVQGVHREAECEGSRRQNPAR